MRIYKKLSINELKNYNANSRTHSKDQIELVINSIKEFGFTNPILIDEENTIIAGHARLQAAKALKLKEVPVVVIDDLSEAQKRAYIIADNKTALESGWDFGILASEFEFLDSQGFDLALTAFSEDEIAEICATNDIKESFCDEDEVPTSLDGAETITKPGDLWLLGEHRLLCGDSTVATDAERLLDGNNPNLMVTDPPYGVKYEAGWRATAKDSKPTEREANSNLMNDDRADWYDAYVLFPGAVAYVWHASSFTDVVMDGLRRAGFEVKQQIIWNKNVHALSRSDYHWKHEPCWYAVKKDGDRKWRGGRTQMTVWDVANVSCEKDKTGHPTQKPVEIFTRSIDHHTVAGDSVYDPFSGSGTLCIACEKSGRKALMMELDPKYCDIIIARWEKFTGSKAERHE